MVSEAKGHFLLLPASDTLPRADEQDRTAKGSNMNMQLKRQDLSARPLAGKVSVVTGSTSGIGLGIARALAQAGSAVVLNGFGDPSEIARAKAGLAAETG